MVEGTPGTSHRTRGATDLPGARPHCCGGSSRSGHQACSLARLRTPETPFHQIQCLRCSHPTSSLLLASSGGGCCIRRWRQSPPHTSASPRKPRRPQLWRARRRTRGWLRREVGGGERSGMRRRVWGPGLRGEGCVSPKDLRRRESVPKEIPPRAQEEVLDVTPPGEEQGWL